ncbi:hypothetical protein [Jatrophihabitans sp.]|uniref:hypothetical protein n=1 Tax=Jatrophihabitans sp. TaxID=1932789 RepID=UPI0030C74E8F|nr:hypothetical protein [Jatrophihabitans sp.]
MTSTVQGGARGTADPARYVSWFHELDAWTEYWDIYHPETRGHFYFGDGDSEPGLLSVLLPRFTRPPAFETWLEVALRRASPCDFVAEISKPRVADAVLEVDDLMAEMFGRHFGDATDREVQAHYLEATHLFALDALPPATERAARVAPDDHRARTAGRHTLDGDIMWFAWALHTEAAQLLTGDDDPATPRRALMLAAVAAGCPANFVWRGHRRTRPEYRADDATAALLRERGLAWAQDWRAGVTEIRALYRIREWGHA